MLICGGHFAVHSYIKSSCCTPQANTMLYISYISLKKSQQPGMSKVKLFVKETIIVLLNCST